MKRFILLLLAFVFTASVVHAQAVLVGSESFDGSTYTFTSTPGLAWMTDTTYKADGTKSIWGMVPTWAGDSIILTTPIYDCSSYGYVTMRFSHICKVSPMDQVQVQYRLNVAGTGGAWQDIPASAYEGSAANYAVTGFNASSYAIWNAADSLALPANTWWKEEIFDLSNQVSYDQVQFRFVLKKGNVSGTNISYGWLIDKFEIMASAFEIKAPVVEFLSIFPDTVYYTGPYLVRAKAATRTAVYIQTPYLHYTAIHPSAGTITDSVLMTSYSGDSLWQAYIPQFIYGTSISYSLKAYDANGNNATANNATPFISQRFIGGNNGDSIQVGTSLSSNCSVYPFSSGGNGLNYAQHLYKGSDIITDNAPRLINKIAFYTPSSVIAFQKGSVDIYLTQTSKNALNAFEDPMVNSHQLVYSGPITIKTGWNEITFRTPFILQPGQNLIYTTYDNSLDCGNDWIYWSTNHTGNYGASYTSTYYKSTGYNCNNSSTNSGYDWSFPTTKFYFGSKTADSSSVSMVNIAQLTDTIVCSPIRTQPVVVEFRNEGIKNLTSAVFGWTLNGVLQNNHVAWTGNLSSDMNGTFQIGSYTPTLNGYDTVCVWVNMPNGVVDTNYYDDTITQIVYGTADLEMEFTKKPREEVFSTGPYDIEAKIHSRTGQQLSNVNLVYIATDQSDVVTKTDTLGMRYIGDEKYMTTIPCISFGSTVNYSITLTDTMGNILSVANSYKIIKTGTQIATTLVYDTTIFAGDTNNYQTARSIFPFNYDLDYSWSRMLFLSSELKENTITNIAFKLEEWDDNGSHDSMPYNACYMKLVDSIELLGNNFIDPITDGATLVWRGTIPDLTGYYDYWVDFELDNPFDIPAGKNLLVYWVDSSGVYDAHGYSYWWYNSAANVDVYTKNTYIGSNLVSPQTARPVARFQFANKVPVPTGGAGGYVYVDTANCKNNRPSDEHVIIDDALAMWSKIIYPASKLQAGTISKIGFYLEEVDDGGGRYTPVAKPNVFIYMRATNDTAITSSTYVQPFAEGATLVWNGTVPAFDVTWQDYWYDFNLQVPFTINNGENLLVYIVDSSCSSSGDCYYMWYMNNSGLGDSRVGSLYSYCNYANASGYQDATPVVRFYYEGAGNGSGISNLGEYVYTDTSNMNPRGDEECVIVVDEVSGWQKYLYYASEISANEDGGTITRLGFYLKNTDGGDEHDKINQYVFMQAVSDTEFVSGTYVDPILEGATLVWSGTVPNLKGYSNYWYDFNLQQPFTLPPGYHLKVTIIDSSCTGGDDCYYWYCQQTNNDTRLSAGWWSRCDYSNSTGRPDNLRPVARFYMPGSATNVVIEDAVALENIITPRDGVPVGNIPIEVVIRNKGEKTLDSCLISYTINNGTPIVYTYRGSLEEDFVDTVIIGTYNGVAGHFDSLVIYVSYPNGVAETQTLYDDTLDVVVVPCGGIMSGTYIVGSSANAHFANFEQFKQTAKYCGMSGTVKLAYENGTYDNIDLSGMTSIKQATDTLIITSQSGNAADVVFTSATASYIINIGDNKNVYLQNITINNTSNSSGERSCVYLKAADNIEIAGCVLNLPSSNNTTNSSAILYNGYNYNPNNNFIGNVRILNNTIIGGYSGISIQRMNSSSQYNNPANITIVGNTIKNFECQGIYSESYCSFDRITDNKIICGSSCLSSFWGIYMNYARIDTIARNVITIEGVASSSGYGMYLYQVIGKGNGNCFVVNNEIFEKKNNSISNYVYGIYFCYSSGTIYHNTIYLAKNSGTQFCFYSYQNSSNLCSIKNNIFYSASQTSAPVYLYSNSYSTFNIDYNNYYSANPNNCVRWSNTTYSLSGWKQFFNPLDSNSISVVPNFRDTSINLDITNYNDMIAHNVGINEDVIGNIRLKKTPMGAHAPYIAVIAANLSAVQIVEPMDISIGDGICAPDYTPVKVIISNTGTDSVDFALTPMRLSLRISGTISLSIDTIINIGGIDIFEQDTFELISNLNVAAAGAYYMTAFLTCVADTFNVDDTISKTYAVRLPLPMDENFAGGLPATLSIIGNNANSGWKVVGGNVNNVVSQYGNAMLEFEGTRGTESKLYTGQMSFVNVNKPTLEFWYYHDTSATSSQRDYTSVAYTIDGGTNFKELLNLYKNNGTDHGWKQYTLSLDSAVGNSCVNIIFYTMRSSTSAFDGNQYIDRIRIYTKQDVAVSEILLDNMTTCHLYSDVNVVLENKTNQLVDFSETPTDLQVEIIDTTNQKITILLNSGVLMPLQTDTLTIATAMSFINGNYTISAKIVSAIDEFPANDTLSKSFVVNPSIDVVATQITGGNDNTNCIESGSQVNQVVVLENDGNMDMEDVIVTLNVYDITGAKVQTVEDTLAGVFAVNQTTTYTFAEAYEVPEGAMYNVEVVASPMCNATLTYTDVLAECVDQSDVEVTAFINPIDDETCSSVGENIKVKVRVSNNHPDEDIEGVVLNVVVTSNNNQIASWTETLDVISAEDFIDFEFPHGFNVPEEADYTIVAYVNSVDTKSSNDTLSMTKCTDLGVVDQNANAMSLGQNIPNPAKTQTVVNYTVPTNGTVVFTLTTVTGQVIYTQSQEVEAGHNSVVFNTTNLATGIYFYTMDFNGQRLTKKMTIRK